MTKRFSVNLQQGNRISTDSLIVLHINPRFESRGRAVIVNSRGGRWGEEKRIEGSRNPLHCGANFLLTIRQQLNHFDIELNGSKAAEFKHRLLPDVADSLFIEGDAIVDRILVF